MTTSDILQRIARGEVVKLKTRPRAAAALNGAEHILQAIFAQESAKHQDIDQSAIEVLCKKFGLMVRSDAGNGSKRSIVAPSGWGGNSHEQTVMPFHEPHGSARNLSAPTLKELALLLVYFGAVDEKLAKSINLERYESLAKSLKPSTTVKAVAENSANHDQNIPYLIQGTSISKEFIADLVDIERRPKALVKITSAITQLWKNDHATDDPEPELLLAALRLLVLGDSVIAIQDKFRDRQIQADSFANALQEWLDQPARKTRTLAGIKNELEGYLPTDACTADQINHVLQHKMALLESALSAKHRVERTATAPQNLFVQKVQVNPAASPTKPTRHPTDLRPYNLKTEIDMQWQRCYYLDWLSKQPCEKQPVTVKDYLAALSDYPPQPLYWLFGANNFFRDQLTAYMTEVHMAIAKRVQYADGDGNKFVLHHLEFATESIRTPPGFIYHIGHVLYNINNPPKASKSLCRDLMRQMQQPLPKDICPAAMLHKAPLIDKISTQTVADIQKKVVKYYGQALTRLYEQSRLPAEDLAKITFTAGRLDEPRPDNKVLVYRQPFAVAVYADPDLIQKYFPAAAAGERQFRGFDPGTPDDFKGLIGQMNLLARLKLLEVKSKV